MLWMLSYAFEVMMVQLLLKKQGFGYIVKLYDEKYGNLGKSDNLSDEKIRKLLSRVDKICFWIWGDAECLHRSLVGFKVLRKHRVEVELVVGVKKFPFRSHAWLEHKGRIINDTEDIKRAYVEIVRTGRSFG